MKKMLLATALALLITGMCSTDLLFKTNRSSSTKGNHHPSFSLFVSGIGQKKTVDAAKICGAENVVKTETQQTFVRIARFYYFRHLYSAGSACIAHNNCMSRSIDKGNSICTAH